MLLPRRGSPLAAYVVAGVIIAAYAAFLLLGRDAQEQVFYAFALIPERFDANSGAAFDAWYEGLGPLFGHVLLHGGIFHLTINMMVFLQAAPFVAVRLGAARFLLVFMVSALGGALAYIGINPHSDMPAVGASGAICGVFAAYFLAVRPTPAAALADPAVRNAMASFLGINVVLMGVLAALHILPIAWEAHLGGFIGGALTYLFAAPRRRMRGPWG
jgi:membrane associated rhomboid family serine protease